SNPTLEELPSEGGLSLDAPESDHTDAGDNSEDSQSDELDFTKEFELLGKLDDDWRDYMSQAGGTQPYTSEDAEKRQHFLDSLVSTPSLQEHLMQQAAVAGLSSSEFEAIK